MSNSNSNHTNRRSHSSKTNREFSSFSQKELLAQLQHQQEVRDSGESLKRRRGVVDVDSQFDISKLNSSTLPLNLNTDIESELNIGTGSRLHKSLNEPLRQSQSELDLHDTFDDTFEEAPDSSAHRKQPKRRKQSMRAKKSHEKDEEKLREIEYELFQLKAEKSQRDQMSIHQKADLIKNEVAKIVNANAVVETKPPDPTFKHEETATAVYPMALLKVSYISSPTFVLNHHLTHKRNRDFWDEKPVEMHKHHHHHDEKYHHRHTHNHSSYHRIPDTLHKRFRNVELPIPLFNLNLHPTHNIGESSVGIDLSPWNLTDENIRLIAANNDIYTALTCANTPHFYDNRLKLLASSSSNLVNLHLRNCQKITSYGIEQFLDKSRCLLRSLDLSHCALIDDVAIVSIVKHTKNTLKEFNVSYCANVTDKGILALADCEHLHYLDASRLPNLTDFAVGKLLRSCTHLHSLYLAGCKGLTGACFMANEPSTGLPIALVLRVRNLDLSYCGNLGKEVVNFVGAGCHHLETLHICSYAGLQSEELESLSFSARTHLIALNFNGWVDISSNNNNNNNNNNINSNTGNANINNDGNNDDEGSKVLKGGDDENSTMINGGENKMDDGEDALLHHNNPVTPEAIVLISTNFQKLMTLKMAPSTPSTSLPAKAFLPIFSNMPTLTYLDVSNNVKLSEQSLPNRAYLTLVELLGGEDPGAHPVDEFMNDHELIGPLQNPNLTHFFAKNAPHLNDAAMKYISVAFPNLQTLDAPNSPLIGEYFPPFFRQLGSLNLAGSHRLNDDSVKVIAENNNHLQDLHLGAGPPIFEERINEENFAHSTHITSACLGYLSAKCRKLSTLKLVNLSGFGGVSSGGEVGHLRFPHLLTLSLPHNEDLGLKLLLNICHAAPHLIYLDVSNCPIVNNSSKVGPILAKTHRHIQVPPKEREFTGFKPIDDWHSTYFRDAYFSRVELENAAVRRIIQNYRVYKRNVLWRWWSSAKKIKKQYKLYKWRRTCADYTMFVSKLKRKRAQTRRRRKQVLQRCFQKIRNSAIDIQRVYRGFEGRNRANEILDEISAAASIQSAFRGMKVRLQDHIWVLKKKREMERITELIESGVFLPNPDSHQEVDRKIREDMPKLRGIIDGVLEEEPKMTFNKDPQPRRFDKEPYVELPFNRKLPIYGGTENNLYKIDTKQTHIFGAQMWPNKKSTVAENDSYDPTKTYYQNFCDNIEKKTDMNDDPYNPMPRHISHPKCALCKKRYMALTCAQCHESYCVQCSEHVHKKPSRQHHQVTQYHHIYVKPKPEVGIVPHMTAAMVAMKKSLALTNLAQNAAELHRIEEQKKLEREMEDEAERERIAAKEAALIETHKHDAARTLQAFFHSSQRRAKISATLLSLSEAVKSNDLKQRIFTDAAIKCQKTFRGFSTRAFFKSKGISVSDIPTLGKKEIAAQRVWYDFSNRRSYARRAQISHLEDLKSQLAKKATVESEWVHKESEAYEMRLDKGKKYLAELEKQVAVKRALLAEQEVGSDMYMSVNREMSVLVQKKNHQAYIRDIDLNGLRLLTSHLRQVTRRNVQSQVQSGEAAKHLKWVQDESDVLRTLRKFVKDRLNVVNEGNNKYCAEWLNDQHERITNRLIVYDTEQESVIEVNLARCSEELKRGTNDRVNLKEILNVLMRDLKFDAEKVGCEISTIETHLQLFKDSPNPEKLCEDTKLVYLERIANLKGKQQALREEVLPNLMSVLQASFTSEDKIMDAVVTFKGDEQGNTRNAMGKIKAVLRHPPKSRKLFLAEKWMDLYRSQPWLAKQNAEESLLRGQRAENRKKLDKKRFLTDRQANEVKREEEEVAANEKKIEEYTKKSQDENASELDKRDFEELARNLRMEIDDGKVGRQKRKERLEKEQKNLQEEIDTVEAEEAEAQKRLANQMKQIEEFKTDELKEDVIELEQILEEKKKIEREELVILRRAEAEEEEHLASSGGVVSGEDGSITVRTIEVRVFEAKNIIACDKPGKNRAKWTSDPYVVVGLFTEEEVVQEEADETGHEVVEDEKKESEKTKIKEDDDDDDDDDDDSSSSPKGSPADDEEKQKVFKYVSTGDNGRTKKISKTLNPVWTDEIITLGGKKKNGVLLNNLNKVAQPVLEARIFDSDFGKDDEIGVVRIKLKDIDQSGKEVVDRWYVLETSESMREKASGEIRLGLKYSGSRNIKLSEESRKSMANLQKRKDEVVTREKIVKDTIERRELFALQAQKDAEDEVAKQKLKDLQEDIRLRKIAVLEAEKELKKQLEEERLEQIAAEEAIKKANWQAREADENIKNLGVAGMSADGRKRAKFKTVLKQFVRKKAGTRDDPEELQMVATIKKRMRVKGGQVEAIRHIKFTVGKKETDDFTSKNSRLQSEGMPFFRRIEREIGLHEQIVIWVEKTIDQEEFITSLELGHTNPESDLFLNLKSDGWERSGHELMKGAGNKDPSFCVWFHKDGRTQAIADLNISYSMNDESELKKEGYEMLETNLSNFGFGDMNLWFRKIDRASVPTTSNSAHVARELLECRKMLSKNPDDEHLQMTEDKLKRKLHAAQVHEDESRENLDNPIKYTMEFLALTPAELETLITYFGEIDTDRDGFITMDEFSAYVGEPMSKFMEHMFNLTEATDNYKRLDFGETIKALSTFAMLYGNEVLRLCFAMYDPEGSGYVSKDNVMDLLSILHPRERGRTSRTLKEFDLPKNGKVTFEMIEQLDIQYPNLFFPAKRIQDSVRKHFFGLPWWEAKLRKYMYVKNKLKDAQVTSQTVDQGAMKKEERKEKKVERKKSRIAAARESKSQFVRALYVAKNVADALIPDVDVRGESLNPFTKAEEAEEMRLKKLQEEIEEEYA